MVALSLMGSGSLRAAHQRNASMNDAVAAAATWAVAGDVVVLAPAAASFDMFDDYAARGDAFRAAVHALDRAEPEEADA